MVTFFLAESHKVDLLDGFPLIDDFAQLCFLRFIPDRYVLGCLEPAAAPSVFPVFNIALDQGVPATAGTASGGIKDGVPGQIQNLPVLEWQTDFACGHLVPGGGSDLLVQWLVFISAGCHCRPPEG